MVSDSDNSLVSFLTWKTAHNSIWTDKTGLHIAFCVEENGNYPHFFSFIEHVEMDRGKLFWYHIPFWVEKNTPSQSTLLKLISLPIKTEEMKLCQWTVKNNLT